MNKYNFNKNWEFTLDNDLEAYNHYGLHGVHRSLGAPERFYHFSNWKRVDLPHDWAIKLPKDLRANTYSGARAQTRYNRFTTENNSILEEVYAVGWYRKEFPYQDSWKGKRIFLEFEGIYRNAMFWVNGVYMDSHASGYTSHLFEITDILYEGVNSIAVRVDAEQAEGWWYEGAGIYRNVHLLVAEAVYCKPYETVVKATVDGKVSASALLINDTDGDMTLPVQWKILDGNKNTVCEISQEITVSAYSQQPISAQMQVDKPLLWDIDAPNLYTLTIDAVDHTEEVFGFRSFAFDADKGFFLNGRPVKIKGACVHQDFGGVGVALSDNLNRYKIQKLKEMGVNAYRCSHHAPSPAILRACDELGMLVMDETRLFGTSPAALKELSELVKRDRNHPSIFIWSIGNEEIRIQDVPIGETLGKKVCRILRELDDTRVCTYGANDSQLSGGTSASVTVRGVNYLRNTDVDAYHKTNPTQPIFGTEESSFLLNRCDIATDMSTQSVVANGMVTVPWGSTPKGMVKHMMQRPWYMGAFMWTGFDYHGEPLPFVRSAFSSYFGAIDLCGMEKPVFYYFKAWYENAPVLKLTPHWNHREGEKATVNVFTNCEHITLKLNGKTVGEQDVAPYDAPEFTLDFVPGVLEVTGVKDGKTYTDTLRTAGKAAAITQSLVLPCETDEDIGIVEISAVDENGILCADDHRRVALHMTAGDIVGVGNGNPTDAEYEQKPEEYRHFHIRSFETEYGIYTVPPKQENVYIYSPFHCEDRQTFYREAYLENYDDDYRDVAKRESVSRTEPAKTYTFVNRSDLTQDYTYLEFERLYGKATVYLDGVEVGNNLAGTSANNRPFRFYCQIPAGHHEVKVVTTISDGTVGGMSGYVRFGKQVNRNKWEVDLFGGKARIFVKYKDAYRLSTAFCEND